MRHRTLTIRKGRSIMDGPGFLVAVGGVDVAFAVDATAAKAVRMALRQALRSSSGDWGLALASVRETFARSQSTRIF